MGKVTVVVWERWWTADTKDTCARCRSLNGQLFRSNEGPQPPLHHGCHCERRYSHTEIVEAGEHVALVRRPGEGWREAVMAEIASMVDHTSAAQCAVCGKRVVEDEGQV